MANNRNVNKVIYDGVTLIDVTDTTATESDVVEGKVFTKADGSKAIGTANYMDLVSNPTANDILTTDANGQAIDSGVSVDDLKAIEMVDLYTSSIGGSASSVTLSESASNFAFLIFRVSFSSSSTSRRFNVVAFDGESGLIMAPNFRNYQRTYDISGNTIDFGETGYFGTYGTNSLTASTSNLYIRRIIGIR